MGLVFFRGVVPIGTSVIIFIITNQCKKKKSLIGNILHCVCAMYMTCTFTIYKYIDPTDS